MDTLFDFFKLKVRYLFVRKRAMFGGTLVPWKCRPGSDFFWEPLGSPRVLKKIVCMKTGNERERGRGIVRKCLIYDRIGPWPIFSFLLSIFVSVMHSDNLIWHCDYNFHAIFQMWTAKTTLNCWKRWRRSRATRWTQTIPSTWQVLQRVREDS